MTGKSKRGRFPMPASMIGLGRGRADADVPCNGCTACCKSDIVELHPELGDDLAAYGTAVTWRKSGITGELMPMLKRRADGACVFLGESGCTIHEKRPKTCRAFDCRDVYRVYKNSMSPVKIKQTLRRGGISRDVWKAGKERSL